MKEKVFDFFRLVFDAIDWNLWNARVYTIEQKFAIYFLNSKWRERHSDFELYALLLCPYTHSRTWVVYKLTNKFLYILFAILRSREISWAITVKKKKNKILRFCMLNFYNDEAIKKNVFSSQQLFDWLIDEVISSRVRFESYGCLHVNFR